MSTSVARYTPPLLPADVSKYETFWPPLSKFSASIVPGTGHGVPPNGVLPDGGGGGGGGGGVEPFNDNRNQLNPPTAPPDPIASNDTRSTRCPAVSGMPVVVIVVHASHAPVFGTVIGLVRSTPSTSTWNVPTPMFAMRVSSV